MKKIQKTPTIINNSAVFNDSLMHNFSSDLCLKQAKTLLTPINVESYNKCQLLCNPLQPRMLQNPKYAVRQTVKVCGKRTCEKKLGFTLKK